MAANAILAPHVPHKDPVKLMRAEVAVERVIEHLRRLIRAIARMPSPNLSPREAPPLSVYSSYFY